MIKKVKSSDTEAVINLVTASGLFDAEEIDQISDRLKDYANGNKDIWLMAVDRQPVGVVYCAPEPMTEGTWNILMLLVSSDAQRQGHGSSLMLGVEQALIAQNLRLLLVETSSGADFEGARTFYAKCGYTEEARIRNFYAAGDDKIIFSKSLTA